VRKADGRRIVLKVLDGTDLAPEELARLEHELDLKQLLRGSPAVEPLALSTLDGQPALELEDFAGVPLDRLPGTPLPVPDFLALAATVAAALSDIHGRGLIHKDIKPSSILFDAERGRVKIGGFGFASRAAHEQTTARPGLLVDESLPYVSPEQTGRLNRVIDGRSDLYSLGVTFYQLLTGRLPFEAGDALGWVYCHVARKPPPPDQLRTALPAALSAIVLKLLAKIPDERYQSAGGLHHDLELCLRQWQATGQIAPFRLGERDASDRFLVPQLVYGRDAECAALRAAFERVADSGSCELVLVSGGSGVGKSAVVSELRRPVIARHGLFVSGKFEQFKRDIPYLTVMRAFRELTLDILAESGERITAWRRRLEAALGPNGQLVVDLIPQVGLIVGPQPPVPELPLGEAENRLRMVLRQFVCAFADRERPLVVFLDDLHWADGPSLNLLADLVASPDTRHLLLVGAFRDNEVGPSHPLRQALDRLRAGGGAVRDIVIEPLPQDELARLVADTVHRPPAEAAPLARLVLDRTGGNPFFAVHFLTALHHKQLIAFDHRERRWSWDMTRIRAERHTDNVVDLMVGKLRELPAETQRALTLAACIGAIVDAQAMDAVLGVDAEPVLRAALEADLLLRAEQAYRFPHDRVQEAAYLLIPESERAATHLRIGRTLWARAGPDELPDRVFEIVNQLNRGVDLITARDERERVAELNLLAGRRAKDSAAYPSAIKYFAAGTALLAHGHEGACTGRHDLAFALEFHRAECEPWAGAAAAAADRLAMLADRAANLVELAAVTCAEVSLYTAQSRADRAIEVSLDYLRRVGIDWSPHPDEAEVAAEFRRLWLALGERPIESLVDLPLAADADRRATMNVLSWTSSPAIFTDERLHCLLVTRLANMSLEHGNSAASCLAYARLGMLIGPRFGDYARAFQFGKLGFDLVEKRGLLLFKALVFLDFAALITPWTRPLSEGLVLVRRAFDAAQESGNLVYACYSRNCLETLMLARGDPLADVQAEAETSLVFVENAHFELPIDSVTIHLQLIRSLRGKGGELGSLDGGSFDEARFERSLRAGERVPITACWYWVRKLQARCLAGDHAAAVAAAEEAEPLLWTSPSFFETAEYHFYGGLARAARHDEVPPGERPRHLAALLAHGRQLAVWARNCPENFAGRSTLVAAEIARVEGRTLDAEGLYAQAIQAARDGGCVQVEASAYEMAARFWRARGLTEIADVHLARALERYRRWGAEGKARRLEQLHPQIVRPGVALPATVTLAAPADRLDLMSVIKASQTISGVIDRDELLRTMLEIVVEQGGARRARLILATDGELGIAGDVTKAPGGDTPASTGVPESILRYVARTQERVLLDDAAADAGRFASDPYLARARPRSVLCLPIRRQADVVALLYLENDLAPGVFTPERLTALELIAAQAAISLENALLLGRERQARAEAEAAERRAVILGEATAVMSSTLDYEALFGTLARLCVRELADWVVIDLAEGGKTTRVAGAHRDPDKEPVLRELAERYPPRLDSIAPVSKVLAGGGPVLLSQLTDAELRALCIDEHHAELARELGTRSAIVVPLVAREARVGALALVSGTPHRFTAADVDLFAEIGRRMALTIDNSRLLIETQRAVHLRDQFLSVASHELRTPITSLKLRLETLQRAAARDGGLPGATLGYALARLLHSTVQLQRLTDELLDVTRIEQGQMTIHAAEVDLGAVVREVTESLELDLTASGCALSIRSSGPVMGRWDARRLDQVVTNLLSNAIKFGAGRPIEVSVRDAGQTAQLTVEDHGIGIDAARVAHVFDRFERAVSPVHYGGLGLGLYLARAIVEAHGGTIGVESRLGHGSTFTVTLPRTAPAAR
jgi:predicted ATPase/signal transduction histidine kinase